MRSVSKVPLVNFCSSIVGHKNIESGFTVGLAADRCVGDNQCRAWIDQRANVLEKGGTRSTILPPKCRS
jgi:hypothetical protein